MTMETVVTETGSDGLDMCDMENGDVCYVPMNEHYVLCVEDSSRDKFFLILDNYETPDTYDADCTLTVQPLKAGGSITIKFT